MRSFTVREIVSRVVAHRREFGDVFAPDAEELTVRLAEPLFCGPQGRFIDMVLRALRGQQLGVPSAWDGSIA